MNKLNQGLSRLDKIKMAKELLLKRSSIPAEQFPMSSQQQRMWLVSQSKEASVAYNLRMVLHVEGQPNTQLLEKSVKTVFARHPGFCTRYELLNDSPVQTIEHGMSADVIQVELTEADDKSLQTQIELEVGKEFDLSKGPVAKARIFKLSENHVVLLLVVHHIATDSVSMDILRSELTQCYQSLAAGQSPSLPALKNHYGDYAKWQESFRQSDEYHSQLRYWQEKLADLPAISNVITDKPRPTERRFRGHREIINIDAEINTQITTRCQQQGVTKFMYLLACYKLALASFNRATDLVVGTTIANRDSTETENIIGHLINNLVLRTQMNWDTSFDAFLAEIKTTCLEAYGNAQVPFDDLVDCLKPTRSASYSPLFQNLFTFHGNKESVKGQNAPVSVRSGDPLYTTSIFELTLDLIEREGRIVGHLEYDSDLYDKGTIQAFIRLFHAVVQQSIELHQGPLSEFMFVTKTGRESGRVLQQTKLTTDEIDKGLLQRIAQNVVESPEQLALSDASGRRFTYQELWREAHKIATAIRESSDCESPVVGIAMSRSALLPLSVLGVLLAGGTYLPIEQDLPEERANYMLSHAQCRLVITESDNAQTNIPENYQRLPVEKVLAEKTQKEPGIVEDTTEKLAYVIYTSGTTGKPKAVAVGHTALLNRLEWMQTQYALTSDDVVLHKTPISFDVSVWELLWPFMAGAQMFVAEPGAHREPAKLNQIIADHKITTIHFVPALLEAMLGHIDRAAWQSICNVFCSGEKLEKSVVSKFYSLSLPAKLHNLYGPTEAAIDVTYFDCSDCDNYSTIPIGKCISNISIDICAPNGSPIPDGLYGEIMIAGVGLAEGYLYQPELTECQFIEKQRAGEQVRFYRTGDIGRYLPDGNIEYWGRQDNQVKIRGVRVELEEIERTLSGSSNVSRARILLHKNSDGSSLLGFVTLVDTSVVSQKDDYGMALIAQLKKQLPVHMLPLKIMVLEDFPSGTNGKVDDAALIVLNDDVDTQQISIQTNEPLTAVEASFMAEVSELLSIDVGKLQLSDSFIDKGGNSLLAMKLISRIDKKYGVSISVMEIFDLDKLQAILDFVLSSSDQSNDEQGLEIKELEI